MNSRSITYLSHSPQQTERFGAQIGTWLQAGHVISLDGTLGGGKTVIAKGLISGALGIDPNSVTSPAFSLVNEFRNETSPLTIYHMDFYRLESLTTEDFEMFSEYFNDENGVVIAEWGTRFLSDLSRHYLLIELDYLDEGADESRSISFSYQGEDTRYAILLENIQHYVNDNS